MKQSVCPGKVRRANPPFASPPCLTFTLPLSPTYKKTVLLPFFFCSPASAAAVVCPAGSCLSSSHLSQLGQHTICDNSFLRINICSGCVPVLLPCPFLLLATLLPDRLRFCLLRCPPCPDLPFVYSVCFRTLFKLTCAYFLMVSSVCMWLLLLCHDPKRCRFIVI